MDREVRVSVEYQEFLERKKIISPMTGFSVERDSLHPELFGFQRDIVAWSLKRGRAAMFEGCGLGKTFQQLIWGEEVAKSTGNMGILLAPLAVTYQTLEEAHRWGVEARTVERQSECGPGINITNYDKLKHFDASKLGFVILDESSILKAYDGKFRNYIIESFQECPYRLACTATPAPNDYMELGNHAEFIGIMTRAEMLATFFTHDGSDTPKWTLKGHAEDEFWKWVCSWAVMIQKPSDIGYSNDGFDLPPLTMHHHIVDRDGESPEGSLFAVEAKTLQERQRERKSSTLDRVKLCADLVNSSDERWVIWCDRNDESSALAKLINDAVEVKGSDKDEHKEKSLLGFTHGIVNRIVSKPSIAGYGLNWQDCHNIAFVGLSDSWEQYYQAIRRCHRFGQTSPVECHVITSSLEGAVVANIERKELQAQEMQARMIEHMRAEMEREIRGASREEMDYYPSIEMTVPKWLKEVAV
jgi:Helicase conserved C-terminal domain